MDKLLSDYKDVRDKRILERRSEKTKDISAYLKGLPDVADEAGAVMIEPATKTNSNIKI